MRGVPAMHGVWPACWAPRTMQGRPRGDIEASFEFEEHLGAGIQQREGGNNRLPARGRGPAPAQHQDNKRSFILGGDLDDEELADQQAGLPGKQPQQRQPALAPGRVRSEQQQHGLGQQGPVAGEQEGSESSEEEDLEEKLEEHLLDYYVEFLELFVHQALKLLRVYPARWAAHALFGALRCAHGARVLPSVQALQPGFPSLDLQTGCSGI